MLWSSPTGSSGRGTHSFPDYEDFRSEAKSFTALAAYVRRDGPEHERRSDRDPGLAATSDIFKVLGVSPSPGRAYSRAEDNADAPSS